MSVFRQAEALDPDPDPNPNPKMEIIWILLKRSQSLRCNLGYIGTIEEKIYQRQVMKSGLAGGLESAGLGSWAAESAHFTPEELREGCRVKRSFMIHEFS
jgi:hypothetical protein